MRSFFSSCTTGFVIILFRTRNSKPALQTYYPFASSPFPLVNHPMRKALSDIASEFTLHNETFLEWGNSFAEHRMNQRPHKSYHQNLGLLLSWTDPIQFSVAKAP